MKAVLFSLLFMIIAIPAGFPYGYIEADLNNSEVRFVNVSFAGVEIKGQLNVTVKQEKEALICIVEGAHIFLNQRELTWIKLRLVKKGDIVFLHYCTSPDFNIRGKINLATEEVDLNVELHSLGNLPFLPNKVQGKTSIWGKIDNVMMSGSFVMQDGVYRNREFSAFSMAFLGKPPLLTLTDSQITLKNGNIFKVDGVLNLHDFSNLFPGAKVTPQKVSLAGWAISAGTKTDVVFKKDVDSKLNVLFDAQENDEDSVDTGTELRYKFSKDNFFKLRMQQTDAVVGVERRKEF